MHICRKFEIGRKSNIYQTPSVDPIDAKDPTLETEGTRMVDRGPWLSVPVGP